MFSIFSKTIRKVLVMATVLCMIGIAPTPVQASVPADISPEYIITGINEGGYALFGYSVNSAGDVNQDGYDDVIIGARDYNNWNMGASWAGAAYLYLGSDSGQFSAPAWSILANQTYASMGGSVDTAGDVNSDGYADILVGASQYTIDQSYEGAAFAYYGSANGPSANPDWTGQIDQAGAAYGWSVSHAGDVNHDGYDDVIIGARYYSNGQTKEGKAFLYLGSSTGLASSPAWSKEMDIENAGFGYSVTAAGDVNNDDYGDVLITSYNYIYGQLDGGKAYLFLGSAAGLEDTAAWVGESDIAMDSYGNIGRGGGDVNGDGYSDILVGAPAYDNSEVEGKAYLYLGSAQGPSVDPDWVGEDGTVSTSFGASLGPAGDYNHDGYDDIVVGDPNFYIPMAIAGKVSLYLGGPSGLSQSPYISYTSGVNNSSFGSAVGVAGHFNNDEYEDFLVGAPMWTTAPYSGGRTVLFFGHASCAASATVNNPNDIGSGSLRQAIANICTGGTINFDASLAGQTITLASDLILDKDLTIDGSGLSPQITISGGDVAHLEIPSGVTVTLSDLTITHGYDSGIYSNGNLTVNNSTLKDNTGSDGGAIFSGGIGNLLTIRNSALTQNQTDALGYGGAIAVTGNGIAHIINSTITQNHAHDGGAISKHGTVEVLIYNSTFADNSADQAAEIEMSDISGLSLSNTIFVCAPENTLCYDDVNSIELSNSTLGVGTLADFGLSGLADHGGPTQTMALSPDSPLVDAGDDSACANDQVKNLDQRGVTRPQGSHCDIGAYELQQSSAMIVSSSVYDGWILESAETSGMGGSKNSTATTLRVGDNAANRQYRAILSFDTSSLPDQAIIAAVTLRFKHAGVYGINPFMTHGALLTDICDGSFKHKPALQLADFNARCGENRYRAKALLFTNALVDGWYEQSLLSDDFQYINLEGVTQFRLRFTKDDNNDFGADFLKLFSGNAAEADRPQLVIEYYIP